MCWYIWENARIWGHWNFPLDMYINNLGVSIYKAQNASSFSPSWIPLRIHCLWLNAVANGLIFVELEWQVKFSFLKLFKNRTYRSQLNLLNQNIWVKIRGICISNNDFNRFLWCGKFKESEYTEKSICFRKVVFNLRWSLELYRDLFYLFIYILMFKAALFTIAQS